MRGMKRQLLVAFYSLLRDGGQENFCLHLLSKTSLLSAFILRTSCMNSAVKPYSYFNVSPLVLRVLSGEY